MTHDHLNTNATPEAETFAPSPAAPQPGQPISEADARAILRQSSTPPERQERDPLLEDPADSDPLLEQPGKSQRDPLTSLGGAEAAQSADNDASTSGDSDPSVPSVPSIPSAVEPEPETETEPTPSPEPDDEIAPEEPHGRKQFNIFRKNERGEFVYNARERAAMQFADEEGTGFMEAWGRLFGETPQPAKLDPAETAAPQPPSGAEATEASAAEIQQQIQTLRQQRKEAVNGQEPAKANDLTEQIEDLLDRKNVAVQRDAERGRARQAAARQHEAAQLESMHRAGVLFPEAVADGSNLHSALTLEIAKLERANPAFFRDPEWPESLTAKLATRMGLSPASGKSAASAAAKPAAPDKPAPAPKPAAPRQAARPAPAPGGISGTPRPQIAQDFQVRLAAARTRNDLPALKALMREARSLPRPDFL